MDKMNEILTYIKTTELNELIYAGAKLICEKIVDPLKNTNRKSKPGWKFGLETLIKNLCKQARMIKQTNKKNPKQTKKTKNQKKNKQTPKHVGTKRKKQHQKK